MKWKMKALENCDKQICNIHYKYLWQFVINSFPDRYLVEVKKILTCNIDYFRKVIEKKSNYV